MTVPLRVEGVDVELLHDWIDESYRIVAPKRLVVVLDSLEGPVIANRSDAK